MARTDYVADMEALLTRQLADAEHQMEALQGRRREGAAPRSPLPNLGETDQEEKQAEPDGAHRGAPPIVMPPASPASPASAPAPYARRTIPPEAESSSQPYGRPNAAPPAPPAQAAPGAVAPVPTAASLDELDERIHRLQTLREWLKDDNLRGMIDDVINKHVQAAERRQVYFSAGIGVASLIAGWLLSAISPAGVLLGLLHH